jgi:hypothetical protein
MGIYFIAAGSSSDNRSKTLDRALSSDQLENFLSTADAVRLKQHFPTNKPLYIWGANKLGRLPSVRPGEYVVDFNNQIIAHVFRFCFFTFTGSDIRLQHQLGWDQGARSTEQPRPYPYVYFLRDPVHSTGRNKQFLLRAFGATDKPHFFDGQKYLDDKAVNDALRRMQLSSPEELLGITAQADAHSESPEPLRDQRHVDKAPPPVAGTISVPDWLTSVIECVRRLWSQPRSFEREHEHCVAKFFEALGCDARVEIRFQRSNMDISISKNGRVLAVVEVKSDRSLTAANRAVLNQAFGYANRTGSPIVIISNANYYVVYDRARSLSLEQQFVAEFHLLSLNEAAIKSIENLKNVLLQ